MPKNKRLPAPLMLIAVIVIGATLAWQFYNADEGQHEANSTPSPKTSSDSDLVPNIIRYDEQEELDEAPVSVLREDKSDCYKLSVTQRNQLESAAHTWYGDLGDASKREYWPYQTLDDGVLSSMVAQGDSEAMLQLGLNKLWRATRVSGDRWLPYSSASRDEIPKKETLDLALFDEAESNLRSAVRYGKVFAMRELLRAYKDYPETVIRSLHPNDPFSQEEGINAYIASYYLLENHLVDQPVAVVEVELTDRARARAIRYAENNAEFFRLHAQDKGLPAEVITVPDVVAKLLDDNRCVYPQ